MLNDTYLFITHLLFCCLYGIIHTINLSKCGNAMLSDCRKKEKYKNVGNTACMVFIKF